MATTAPAVQTLEDGFRTLLLAEKPDGTFYDFKFKIQSITPFGLDTGGTIDTSTMSNDSFRTFITR